MLAFLTNYAPYTFQPDSLSVSESIRFDTYASLITEIIIVIPYETLVARAQVRSQVLYP